jgi:hypothetical protein
MELYWQMLQMISVVSTDVYLHMKVVSCGTEECTFSRPCVAGSGVVLACVFFIHLLLLEPVLPQELI